MLRPWIHGTTAALLVVAWSMTVPAAEPVTGAGRVVFVVPEADPETQQVLRDALAAQFAGRAAVLTLERFEGQYADLRAQVHHARQFAASHGAAGVFWLDMEGGDWLLYLSEPSGDRVLVRRVPLTGDGNAAAVEAVAVISQQSATALLAGHTIGMQPVNVPPAPPPDVTPPPPPPREAPKAAPPRRWMRAGLGYRGTAYAPTVGRQDGVSLSAGWVAPFGLTVDAAFVFFEQLEVRHRLASFDVSRRPFELVAGWVLEELPLRLGGGMAVQMDIVDASGQEEAPGLRDVEGDSRLVWSLSPRVRLDMALTPGFGLYFLTGVDFTLNSFPFVARVNGTEQELLRPHGARFLVDAGVALWP